MFGPLQLTVVGFDEDKYARDIILELKKLRKDKIIRLVDLLYLFKHADGTITAKQVDDLEAEEKREFGALLKSLVGLVGQEPGQIDDSQVVEALQSANDQYGLTESEIEKVAANLPNNSSAIYVLFEHYWARGIKEAMYLAGGKLMAQGLLNPATLQKATNELETVLAAVNRAEAATMEKLTDVKLDARSQEEAARMQAAEAIAQAEADHAAAIATLTAAVAAAERRAKEAQEVGAAVQAQANAAQLKADEKMAEALKMEEEARQRIAEATTKAEAMEDEAFAQAEAVRRAAQRQQEKAMAEAAEVERKAKEIEARAITRAMNAMVAAKVIQRQTVTEALDALVEADVLEAAAAREAARLLA